MKQCKKALLLVAHGSRLESSNEEIRTLTRTLAEVTTEYDLVDCAFLELAEPDITTGGHNLIERGATELYVMPYFLVAGRHVVKDVPKDVRCIRQQHPDIPVRITSHLGKSTEMIPLILKQACDLTLT